MLLRLIALAASTALASATATPFGGKFVSGVSTNANGSTFLSNLDHARRMFSAGDEELQTFSGVYDRVHFGATEGSVWSGNIWTQNTYGAGFSSLPFLPQPQLQWLQTVCHMAWIPHPSSAPPLPLACWMDAPADAISLTVCCSGLRLVVRSHGRRRPDLRRPAGHPRRHAV